MAFHAVLNFSSIILNIMKESQAVEIGVVQAYKCKKKSMKEIHRVQKHNKTQISIKYIRNTNGW